MTTRGWRIGSLFSGIGGLELGLERAGLGTVAWQCEWDPWCRSVLAQHWPDAERFEDVRALMDPPKVEVMCGGFPCQPVSVAGKRLAQADERWLWPEFARLIRVVRPRLVVAENVPGLTTAGLGLVLGDLAALGYDAAWDVLSAAQVGAPHRRERLFIVAWPSVDDADRVMADRDDVPGRAPVRQRGGEADGGGAGAMADSDGELVRLEPVAEPGRCSAALAGGAGAGAVAHPDREGEPQPQGAIRVVGGWPVDGGGERGAAEPGMGGGFDGLSSGLDSHRWPAGRGEPQHEWEPPRTLIAAPDRAARLKALGNAVVPQVAEAVGRWALRLVGGAA